MSEVKKMLKKLELQKIVLLCKTELLNDTVKIRNEVCTLPLL